MTFCKLVGMKTKNQLIFVEIADKILLRKFNGRDNLLMKNFIFLTDEGQTFQPSIEDNEIIEVENLQVIGIASGINSDEAYKKLLLENSYLTDTTFETIFCYELSNEYEQSRKSYNLNVE